MDIFQLPDLMHFVQELRGQGASLMGIIKKNKAATLLIHYDHSMLLKDLYPNFRANIWQIQAEKIDGLSKWMYGWTIVDT